MKSRGKSRKLLCTDRHCGVHLISLFVLLAVLPTGAGQISQNVFQTQFSGHMFNSSCPPSRTVFTPLLNVFVWMHTNTFVAKIQAEKLSKGHLNH